MREIPEYKRAKRTGKGSAAQYLGIPHWIIRREEFAAIDGSALKLLVDLGGLYNGYNNGNLSIAEISHRWTSRSKRKRATDLLIEGGWIIKTKYGGLGLGPDLFALSWWPIDACKGKHDYPVERLPSHHWITARRAAPNQVRGVPESGTGNVEQTPKIAPTEPESGTTKAVFQAA